jgi:anaerobic magnesium-protoporphyrin IX monomethyl ester cyclase
LKPDILFVNLPSIPVDDIRASFIGNNEIYQTLAMPLGILYLSSYLKKHNDVGEVAALDYVLNLKHILKYRDIDDFILRTAAESVDFTPHILAFSINFSSGHHFFMMCAEKLKSLWPDAVLIVGGTHATNAFKFILQNPKVDYVCRGEGEIPFAEFIRQYSAGEKISVKGFYSEKNFDDCGTCERAELISNLDEIPFPDWDIVNMGEYVGEKGRKISIGKAADSKLASFTSTRGCPFKCTFCASSTVHGRIVRYRSTENIIAELKVLHEKYGATLFIPDDDLFTAKKSRFLEMLAAIGNLKIPDFEIQLPSALRVNDLDDDVIDALIDTGMKIASLAIESGDDYVQKYIIRKNVDLTKAVHVVRRLKDRGIVVRCYFILGFPGETKEQMQRTVDYARNLGADWCTFIIATPLIGSVMYDQFVELDCIPEDFFLQANTIFSEREFDTPEISAAELNEFAYRANLDINFINNCNKVTGQYEKAIAIYRDIVQTYPFHIIGRYCIMQCQRRLGNLEEAAATEKTIVHLIRTDLRAQKMYKKYGDLMPDLRMD